MHMQNVHMLNGRWIESSTHQFTISLEQRHLYVWQLVWKNVSFPVEKNIAVNIVQ